MMQGRGFCQTMNKDSVEAFTPNNSECDSHDDYDARRSHEAV
jgi:hypothetical protein